MKRKAVGVMLAATPLAVALLILVRGPVEKPQPHLHAYPEMSEPALHIKKMDASVKQPVRDEGQPPKPKHVPDD